MSSMATRRISDLQDFYSLLALLAVNVDGPRKLEAYSGRLSWPQRGVYFFVVVPASFLKVSEFR